MEGDDTYIRVSQELGRPGVGRESEGFIVPEKARTTKPAGGKEPCFIHVFGGGTSE